MDELEEQLADAKVRLRCKQQPIKVSWSARCSQEEVEKERARAFDLQATTVILLWYYNLFEDLKNNLK